MTTATHTTAGNADRQLCRWTCWPLLALALAFSGCGSFVAQMHNADGVQLYQQAHYSEALRKFQEAAYSDRDNADAYYNLAATHHRLGEIERKPADWEQAETNYNLCLDRNGNHVDCYRGLAVLLVQEGRNDEAFRLLQRWNEREPMNAEAKVELARLNDEFGHRQVAKEQLVEALAVAPDNSRALTALGKIREESGETAQALANYQRSLWYDSRQPQVASRVSVLQSRMSGVTPTSDGASTRMVERDTNTVLR